MIWKLVLWSLLGIIFVIIYGFWQSSLGTQVIQFEEKIGQSISQSVGLQPRSLMQQATQYYLLGQYSEAIALWESVVKGGNSTDLSLSELGNLYSNLGAAYRQVGLLSNAIRNWERAVEYYRQAGEELHRGMVLVDLASAYNANGQSKASVPMLMLAIDIAHKTTQKKLEVIAFGVLGAVYSQTGELDKAVDALQYSLKLGAGFEDAETKTSTLNNLDQVLIKRANHYSTMAERAFQEGDLDLKSSSINRSKKDLELAVAAFERAVASSKEVGGIWEVNSIINLVSVNQRESKLQNFPNITIDPIFSILDKLRDSRNKAYALIKSTFADLDTSRKIRSLEQAIAVAKNIGDSATQSYALGILGHTYELTGQLDKALLITRDAIIVAQQSSEEDSLYRWQWQAGRIFSAWGDTQQAINSYRQALASLQSIRSDIIASSVDLQFDVRDEVEPVYRQLMGLLLSGEPRAANIEEALNVSDLLRLSELQDYFGDECVQVRSALNSANFLPSSTATIRSIILADKTYMVLRLPKGELKSYTVALSAKQLEAKALQFRNVVEDIATNEYLDLSQELYELLIRPMESELVATSETLVFINDGLLRNIPMAVLYDGNQFLVEKFNIAYSLGLSLSDGEHSQPQRFRQALIFGLTVGIPPFGPLPGVATETQDVYNIMGGSRFLNADFTLSNFRYQIQDKYYSIVHLATHGKFGATGELSFLQAFDTRINLNQFEKVLASLKHPIDILTLSACETAAGDNRSTLGLAGVAVRNDVKNVLATLWFVNDADTVLLINNFYSYLRQSDISPVLALRKAQIQLIADNKHPALWSSFVVVSNSL